ncbi:O-acetyltransferase [plant metagenome]|uniref:O-acetyltransferase n=1 Tax=plant metagenome TaxID=1297885 RepID=A0A484YG52_9ZZZZ
MLLDAVRALASQLVVFGHGISFFGVLGMLHEPRFPWVQNIAVVVFFVLSGWIITYSTRLKCLDENYRYGHFLIDRTARIYCALLPALVFIFLIDTVSLRIDAKQYTHHAAFTVEALLANILMLQDIPAQLLAWFAPNPPVLLTQTSFGSARVLWTISIEWWIYIFFGLSYFVTVRSKRLNAGTAVALLVASAIPLANLFDGRGNGLTLYWIYGLIACLVYPHYKARFRSPSTKITAFFLFVALCVHRQTVSINAYDHYFALYLSICLLIATDLAQHLPMPGALIRFMAGYSFTLYLVHYSILQLIHDHAVSWNGWTKLAVGFTASNLVAIGLARITEHSLTPLTRRWLNARFYDRKGTPGRDLPPA